MLHVGQPSVTILGAGELLFGKTSPAGRTVQTVYPSSYVEQSLALNLICISSLLMSIYEYHIRRKQNT